MSDNLVPILLITLTTVLLIILFIVTLRIASIEMAEGQRTGGEEPFGGTPPQGGAAPAKGGSLLGFRGKAIGAARENPGKHPLRSLISFAADSYAFVLARHIESCHRPRAA